MRNEELLELISFDRLRNSSVSREKDFLIESESDKGRVINSAAFRRLQQKAQVFPLDQNAAVRTRLTHSLEVSQIGRFLAQKVIDKLGLGGRDYGKLNAMVNIVETSCLIHDIGNPPFGHLGEAAIRKWFKNKSDSTELSYFDGNPQGFRIVSFLSGEDCYGLNLTTSLLLSTIKYPWLQRSAGDNGSDPEKFGLFESDYARYKDACSKLNWEVGKKFPFAKLMEAADDIAYCTSDLEDGLEKGVISEDLLSKEIGFYETIDAPVGKFVAFKTKLIREAVESAAECFASDLQKIMNGTDVDLLPGSSASGQKIKEIKGFARKYIYSNEEVERIEIAGNSAISGILDHFDNLVSMDVDKFNYFIEGNYKKIKENSCEFDFRVFNRLPKSYRDKYRMLVDSGSPEKLARKHLVTDFVSGMTDDFAISTYQVLHGIKVR